LNVNFLTEAAFVSGMLSTLLAYFRYQGKYILALVNQFMECETCAGTAFVPSLSVFSFILIKTIIIKRIQNTCVIIEISFKTTMSTKFSMATIL